MKKTFIIGLLFLGTLLLNGCSLIETIDLEEYQTYLEDKYGKDKDFYMVEKSTCNWFELGGCSYFFSSNELDGEAFEVHGSTRNGEHHFGDEYIKIKHERRLQSYYKNLLSDTFNFDYEITTYADIDYDELDPNIAFEDYLNHENLNLQITFETAYENINLQQLRTAVENMISTNQIKNIESIIISANNCYDENNDDCKKENFLYMNTELYLK